MKIPRLSAEADSPGEQVAPAETGATENTPNITSRPGSVVRSVVQRRNFRNVQIDAIGVGLAGAAGPFLPVFLTRLGATNFQVGLLTAMPALTGLLLAIVIGSILQRQRNIVPWFSGGRLLVISAYAMTGLVTLLVPREWMVITVLAIWAAVTVPQTVVAVCFTVVMNQVAGPQGRYDLMSRRWSILGATTAIGVAVVGQILDRLDFPLNYQLVFMGLSLGGLISYYFSSHIVIPDNPPQERNSGGSLKQKVQNYLDLIRGQPAFVSFAAKRFVYITGQVLAAPLFPLYYVREIQATDSWIGIISTTQTAVVMIGYFLWTRQSKLRGSRYVLLRTTLGLAIYPAIIAMTPRVELIALFAGLAGIFQAGIDLVFFDELMKTVPVEYSATFVSLNQSMQYLSTVIAPIIGTLLADQIGIGGALMVSAAVRLLGFALFAWGRTLKMG